jgi:hypothetical protein
MSVETYSFADILRERLKKQTKFLYLKKGILLILGKGDR